MRPHVLLWQEAPPQERPKPKRSEEEGQAAAEERPSKARGERTKKAPEQEREPQPETPTKKAPPPAAQPQPQAEEDDSNSRRMGRPTTARRAPPKVQSNVATKDTRPTSKQSELRPAVKVIAEGDAADDDDDDGDMSAVQVGAGQRGMGQARHDMDGDHGMLVKNMLQKEQALVNNDGQDHREDGAVSQHEDKERQRTLVRPTFSPNLSCCCYYFAPSSVETPALPQPLCKFFPLVASKPPWGRCLFFLRVPMLNCCMLVGLLGSFAMDPPSLDQRVTLGFAARAGGDDEAKRVDPEPLPEHESSCPVDGLYSGGP
jgi:hypothetical protein